MADEEAEAQNAWRQQAEQLHCLRQGAEAWNAWRQQAEQRSVFPKDNPLGSASATCWATGSRPGSRI